MSPSSRLEGRALAGLGGPWALANVSIWTGERTIRRGSLVFGGDGRVLACGDTPTTLAAVGRNTEVVDGMGAFVCPGFVDPHVHVRASASARLATDVSDARDAGDVIGAVDSACENADAWVTLVGLALDDRPRRRPHRDDLDRVSRGTRVRIRDRSGHGWLFNSAGLAALSLGTGTPAGVIVERGPDRRPTGFVVDHVGWIGERLGRVSGPSRLTNAVRAWSRDLARAGVVALCDATATNGRAEARSLRSWREAGDLCQELTYLGSPDAELDDATAGIKFADAFDPRLPDALRSGRTVAVHCVDPTQTGAALTAASATGGRLRLEHAAFVPPDWIATIRRLGATVVTHPSFVEAHGDRYLDDPSLEPHEWLYRLGSWSRAGVPLAFASDAPFGPPEPLRALRTAAWRRTATGRSLGSAEALVGEAALRAVTVAPAACCGLDRLGYGRLRPGGPGAAVVLSHDPRVAGTLDVIEPLATVIGGEVVD